MKIKINLDIIIKIKDYLLSTPTYDFNLNQKKEILNYINKVIPKIDEIGRKVV